MTYNYLGDIKKTKAYFEAISTVGARMEMAFPEGLRLPFPLLDRVEVLRPGEDPSTLWIAIWIAGYHEQTQPSPIRVILASGFQSEDGWDCEFDDLADPLPGGCFHYRLEQFVEGADEADIEQARKWRRYKEEHREVFERVEAYWERWIGDILQECIARTSQGGADNGG